MKQLVFALSIVLVILSCQKENPNLISLNRVGPLDNTSKISAIETLLSPDSVVISNPESSFGAFINASEKKMEVYDTTGTLQLIIKSTGNMDTIAKIKSIRVLTDRYKTEKNISIGSSFKTLKQNYEIGDIQSSLKSIIIPIKELNAFVSFDRDVLPSDVKFDLDAKITPLMIPDDAEINRFWIDFEDEVNQEK